MFPKSSGPLHATECLNATELMVRRGASLEQGLEQAGAGIVEEVEHMLESLRPAVVGIGNFGGPVLPAVAG